MSRSTDPKRDEAMLTLQGRLNIVSAIGVTHFVIVFLLFQSYKYELITNGL